MLYFRTTIVYGITAILGQTWPVDYHVQLWISCSNSTGDTITSARKFSPDHSLLLLQRESWTLCCSIPADVAGSLYHVCPQKAKPISFPHVNRIDAIYSVLNNNEH